MCVSFFSGVSEVCPQGWRKAAETGGDTSGRMGQTPADMRGSPDREGSESIGSTCREASISKRNKVKFYERIGATVF